MTDRERLVEKQIEVGRRFLRSNWDARKSVVSDQKKGIAKPALQGECPARAKSPGEHPKKAPLDRSENRLVDLVPPGRMTPGGVSIFEAIGTRRSRRKFSPAPLSLEELSFLLFCVQGVRERRGAVVYRTVPSAGCRHALETYVYPSRVEELSPGIYRYLPLSHQLCPVSYDGQLEQRLDEALFGQLWKCASLFVWTAVPYRMEWRHTVAAHKLIALDAGHACQNLYLACEAIGCGTCAIGAYDQDRLDAALGVDGKNEIAVYAAPVGKL